jgi:hypothetical protein
MDDSSQVSGPGNWSFTSATQSSIQDNFRKVIDALHGCNVVEHRRVETTCEDAY